MRFDAYAALANLRSEGGGRATPATCATRGPLLGGCVAQVARVARRTAPDGQISGRPVPADACRTSRTCRTGQAVQSEDRQEAYLALHPETAKPGPKSNCGELRHNSFADDQAAKTGQSAKVIPWPGRGYPPEAIRQGVAEAFADYRATDDPQDPRAWA